MNSKERVITALRCKKPDRVPFMEVCIDKEVGQRILRKEDYDPGELAKVLHLDGIGTGCYPDLYVKYGKNEFGREYILDGLLKETKDLDMIKLIDPGDERLYENIKSYVDKYGKDYAVFCTTNMGLDPLLLGMGMEGFAIALAEDPVLIEKILDIYTDWTSELVVKLQEIGIDIIWFTDDFAFNTSMMFSPGFFREIVKPRFNKVMKNIEIPVIFHSDGHILPVIEDLIELGVNGLHPMDPSAMDIHQVKKEYGSRICLIGNIDLRHTLVNGTVEEVRNEVRDRIEKIGYNGGYILSSANSITNYCKTENILAMRDALLEFGNV